MNGASPHLETASLPPLSNCCDARNVVNVVVAVNGLVLPSRAAASLGA